MAFSSLGQDDLDWNSMKFGSPKGKPISPAVKSKWVVPAIGGGVAAGALGLFLLKEQETLENKPNNTNPADPCTELFTSTTVPANCLTPTGQCLIEGLSTTEFTVMWPDGIIDNPRSDLLPGSYLVSISYGDCSATLTVEIESQNLPITLVLLDVIPPSDPIAEDGGFFVTIDSPAVDPFFYVLNGEAYPLSPDPLFSEEGLAAGTYFLELTDGNGCSGSIEIVLEFMGIQPPNNHRSGVNDISKRKNQKIQWKFIPIFSPVDFNHPSKN